jgi:hypothetical protein
MKKDKIIEFIHENRPEFDDLEPSPFAWDRIENRINSQNERPILRINHWVWKAAVLICVFASAWFLHDYIDHQSEKKVVTIAGSITGPSVLNELAEGEAYYTAQINNKQAELEKYTREHPEIMDDLKREFRELDRDNLQLKEDLVESNANEKVIEAIMQSYRIKLQILEQVLSELKGSRSLIKIDSAKLKQL